MSTPNATILHIPAGVGIDQSIREEHVPPGQANLYAENVRVTKVGSLEKRKGFSTLPRVRVGGAARSTGLRLAAYRDTIASVDATGILDVYSPGAGAWSPIGRLPGCEARRYPVASTGTDAVNILDIAYANGLYIVATREPYGTSTNQRLVAYVVDATTKRIVLSQVIVGEDDTLIGVDGDVLDPVFDVKIIANSAYAVLLFSVAEVASTTQIRAVRMATTDVTAGFTSLRLVAVDVELKTFDACVLSTTEFALAYTNDSAGASRITVKTITFSTWAEVASVSQATNNADIRGLSIAGAAGEVIWLAWSHTTAARVYVAARDAATLVGVISQTALTLDTLDGELAPRLVTIGRTAANQAYVAFAGDASSAATPDWLLMGVVRVTNNAGSLVQANGTPYLRGWVPFSKPFAMGGRVYMEVADDGYFYDISAGGPITPASYAGLVVLVDVTGDASDVGYTRNQTVRPVAQVAPRLDLHDSTGNSLTDKTGCPRHVVAADGSIVASVHITRQSAVTAGISIVEYDFAHEDRHLPLVFGDSLYFSGGVLCRYDGQRLYEAGFIAPPRVAATVGGTGLTGVFAYTAIHEYSDALGNVEWSAPATVISVTAANQTITVVVRRPCVTWKHGYDGDTDYQPQGIREIKTKLYRTTGETGAAGGEFYLLATSVDNPGDNFGYADTTSDATLVGRAKLYKHPGLQGTGKDRQAMGAVRHMVECNSTLVAIGDDGYTLRAFANRVVGEVPWHHDTLQLPVDGDGEAIALASLDGMLVIFKKNAIWICPVEASNDNVTIGGFGSMRQIAVDAGCSNPRSVVTTSKGVFFQSDRGIEILTRSMTVEPIGDKIQSTLAEYPNVTAAVLDARNGLVRFSLGQTGSSTIGVDAVYDLTTDLWVSFDNKTGADDDASTGVDMVQSASAAYANTPNGFRYCWIDSLGMVYTESNDKLDPYETWVPSWWETAWMKLELQREHQMWQALLLYEMVEAAGLVAEVAHDWIGYQVADAKTFTQATVLAYPRQLELRTTGRYQSVKFRFHDTVPGLVDDDVVLGDGNGLEYVGLSLDLAPHQGPTQGTPRLAVAARA